VILLKETEEEGIYFMEYLATTRLYYYHRKSPWIEIPRAFSDLGKKSLIVCSSYDQNLKLNFDFAETKVHGDKISSVIKEILVVFRLLRTSKPRIFLQVNVRSPIFLYAMLDRIFNVIMMRKNRTFWVLKLDWDGNPDKGKTLQFTIRKLLISLNSLFFDMIITESSCALNRLRNFPLMDFKKVEKLPNGYPDDLYRIADYNPQCREDIVLCVARFNPIKRQDLLVLAFAKLVPKFPSWKLLLVGHPENDKYLELIRNTMVKLGIENRVIISTDVKEEQLVENYLKAKIFCLPSDKEGFANVRIEAISNGLPVITSEAGCGYDIDPSGKYVFKTGDISSLENRLYDLMSSQENCIKLYMQEKQILLPYKQIAQILSSRILA
jgi:glycosyltransferase involved in cell wall biosynthesis